MEPFELLKIVAELCERMGIRYLTVGSLATTAFGQPRFTNDIDLVLDLHAEQIDEFCRAFAAPEYYLSQAAVQTAVAQKSQFNIIHTTAGLKVDCFIPDDSPWFAARLLRAVRKRVRPDFEAVFASPEDVILKKLEYFRIGESEKHLQDIEGVLGVCGDQIDREYIARWSQTLGLTEIWQLVLSRTAGR
jgi:hypothetical protein